jgi:hypothetical protein
LDAILGSSPLEASSVNTDFERDPDRAVDSPSLSAVDGDMTSAEDSSDLEWDVFLGSSSESDSSSLESTIKIFFLCDSVDDLEIVELENGLKFSVDDGVFVRDPRLVFELVALKGRIDHKPVDAFFSHLKTLDSSKSAQNNVSFSTDF